MYKRKGEITDIHMNLIPGADDGAMDMNMALSMERYEAKLAAAYVRGVAMEKDGLLPKELLALPMEELSQQALAQIIHAGEAADLRMYHFKKKELLPRVKAVLGFLRSIQPESLLDVGSGRGVFLFPFLIEFPWVKVTSADILPHRVEMLQAISRGGVENLTALEKNICQWEDGENQFDVVTLLEVLEHIPDVQTAVNHAVRLAKRYVVVSVPSKPDNNPEHIHLLTRDILTELFTNAGCTKLHFSGVLGHLVLFAKKGRRNPCE